jgi:hypothetical protein
MHDLIKIGVEACGNSAYPTLRQLTICAFTEEEQTSLRQCSWNPETLEASETASVESVTNLVSVLAADENSTVAAMVTAAQQEQSRLSRCTLTAPVNSEADSVASASDTSYTVVIMPDESSSTTASQRTSTAPPANAAITGTVSALVTATTDMPSVSYNDGFPCPSDDEISNIFSSRGRLTPEQWDKVITKYTPQEFLHPIETNASIWDSFFSEVQKHRADKAAAGEPDNTDSD